MDAPLPSLAFNRTAINSPGGQGTIEDPQGISGGYLAKTLSGG